MARWDELPAGVVLQPQEALLTVARFGRQRKVYWLTSARLLIGTPRRDGARIDLMVPLDHIAAMRLETERGCLWSATYLRLYASSGVLFQDQAGGREAADIQRFCAAVSNQLARPHPPA
jgi:hypothetical protein